MKKIYLSILFLTIFSSNLFSDEHKPTKESIERGKIVYKNNCAICHTVNGGGGMGPDFNMVSYTRPRKAIREYAKDPYKLNKGFGYTANAMPTLPLTDKEFEDVADYIDSLQKFKKWMIKK